MEAEVAKVTNGAVAPVAQNWGFDESIDQKDMIIPMIRLTQKMSKHFDAGKAKEGEFFDSISEQPMGTEITCQLAYIGKVWWVYEDEKKKKFLKSEKVTDANRNSDYTYRDLVYKLTVLVGDKVGARSPYGITLSGTSASVAKQLLSFFRPLGNPAAKFITFRGIKTQNDDGSWYKWSFNPGREATPEEVAEARMWAESITGGSVTHSDEHQEAKVETKVDDDSIPF